MEGSGSTGMVRSSSSTSTGMSTGIGTGMSTGIGTGMSTESGSGISTESGSGISTGMLRSGRAAPSGGDPRALLLSLCLVLALTLLLPTPALALPTPGRALPIPQHSLAEGLNRSRDLLEAARTSLQRLKELDILGFECTLEEVDLEDITEDQINTIKACTSEDPGAGNCPALGRSSFDKRKCLQGIYGDLSAYRAELGNFSDHQVLAPLEEMMRVRPRSASLPNPGIKHTWGSGPLSFQQRLRLCSVLQALRIRSITISRMMNFLSSLESPL
ncbi:interleukin-12 subunit alpha [Pithys albifrons albifrons]|uniref:interleukin-12 subunit alpha n=1 Tax=Pithys albifrons albifrons TaxID=3385563 RepID=UPI003A5D1779